MGQRETKLVDEKVKRSGLRGVEVHLSASGASFEGSPRDKMPLFRLLCSSFIGTLVAKI